MKVCVRPAMIAARPLAVRNPRTGRLFRQGETFDLTPEDIKHPGVRRLLPKSIPGGRDGDLLPADKLTAAERTALKTVKSFLTGGAEDAPAGKADKAESKES